MRRLWFAAPLMLCLLVVLRPAEADEPAPFEALRGQFSKSIRGYLRTYCLDCHSAAAKEGELDLERFGAFDAVRRDPQAWQKVSGMLASREMPPQDSPQPTAKQFQELTDWVRRYLQAEAHANAGDPGPVVLRRLNNSEYTYTVQDLTQVALNPAREFPVDGAAGEGFTNTGNAQGMSPALFQKYLDAGKGIADHVVPLPTGFRFSASTTRRDWADEYVSEIRAIYARHTSGSSDVNILNRWNRDPRKSTEQDGRVNLERYFAALIRHRKQLQEQGDKGIGKIAEEERLNAKYLRHLANMLLADSKDSILLNSIRKHWSTAEVTDAAKLRDEVRKWQDLLWKFNPVGHLGLIQRWQTPVNPLVQTATLRHSLDQGAAESDAVVYLVAGSAGDGTDDDDDVAVWHRPRIEFKDRPAILLRDVRALAQRVENVVQAELSRTDRYLAAVLELQDSSQNVEQVAQSRGLIPQLLSDWAAYVELGPGGRPEIAGHFTKKRTKVGGHDAIRGWSTKDLPVVLANESDAPISFSTLTVPAHSVTVHPTPAEEVVVGWQSPIAGRIQAFGKVADADEKCGNGASWRLELLTQTGRSVVASGAIDNGRAEAIQPEAPRDVTKGDVLLLVVNARDRNHVCDTTHVDLKIREIDGHKRVWDLGKDVSGDILAGNPHADSLGHPGVWHFFAQAAEPAPKKRLPPGSKLAKWRAAVLEAKPQGTIEQRATEVRDALMPANVGPLAAADKVVKNTLMSWSGPLNWVAHAQSLKQQTTGKEAAARYGLDPAMFGRHPRGGKLDPSSLATQAPRVLEIRMPRPLVEGGTFVVEAELDPMSGNGTVQIQLASEKPASPDRLMPAVPIFTRAGSESRNRVVRAYDDFRQLFPAAMCHARIVPVDATVTLVLYHREDDHLVRLMLDDQEQAQLDRLWDELLFVSRDALRMEVALEQILEFATQDSDPKIFDPVRKPIAENAAAFRRRYEKTEPARLGALVDFAARAYRRPLAENESQRLRALYRSLREEGMSQKESLQTTMARILSSPAFLYRSEQPGPGTRAIAVSDWELASRLSYFLWSTMPDEPLRQQAQAGKLSEADVLKAETNRMLRDPRTRRLAIEFACQWLHIRTFDELDEKSGRHFPKFNELRGPMYEESIRFFADLFRLDGSILEILDADHTFLNERLARFYGIPGVSGSEWRRVEGVKAHGRGGILGQASILARQSGASRTSPILRGNWVSETLLGERLPRPPKNVPQLPEDDATLKKLTMRQLITKHSSDAACAKCHARIDPYGFALENFDAIGRFRKHDLGGQPIDVQSKLTDGTTIDGMDGLRQYLLTTRRDTFVRQFCRKLLGYALGRAVQLSDEPLLDDIMARLPEENYRMSVAIHAIVQSKQFRMIRGRLHNPVP